ncbi:MAG TPA: HAD domain-containing protein [Gaiellaceae bacterium]|nr:HAD domain-containing protein [Gaiellaceae bacterium]
MIVIFLDVDGVLNSERHCRVLEDRHRQFGHTEPASPKRDTTCDCFKLYNQIDREAIARLNRLVEKTGAKIVISSSWRKLLDSPELHRILSEHGLVAEIVGETPDGHKEPGLVETYGRPERMERGYEIDYWLRQHPEVERFVILDDGSDMAMHGRRLVQTDAEEGLLDEHVELAVRVLAWDGESSPSPFDEMEAMSGAPPIDQVPSKLGSSVGIHCHHDQHLREGGCPERLVLEQTTAVPPTDDDDYMELFPAIGAAATLLGWRIYQSVWWCPAHVVAKGLACARCLVHCPGCSCMGGPLTDAVPGLEAG